MPELPEVETVRKSLLPFVCQKEITAVQINYPRVLPKNDSQEFIVTLIGDSIIDITRRGKYLLFAMESKLWMIIHLRMTGRLLYYADGKTPLAKHTSAIIGFRDGSQLRFVDQRKFGTIYYVAPSELSQIAGLHTMGPEPLCKEFTVNQLQNNLDRDIKVKGLLLDQKRLAGLGNIYADESLFRAGIHPSRLGSSLTALEVAGLYHSIQAVLTEAIALEGTTIRDYQTGWGTSGGYQHKLKVYGRRDEPCPQCQTPIAKIRIAGRSTHYCPNCQRWDGAAQCED